MAVCSGVRSAGIVGMATLGDGFGCGVGVDVSCGDGPGSGRGDIVGEGWWIEECCEDGLEGGREGTRGWRLEIPPPDVPGCDVGKD